MISKKLKIETKCGRMKVHSGKTGQHMKDFQIKIRMGEFLH